MTVTVQYPSTRILYPGQHGIRITQPGAVANTLPNGLVEYLPLSEASAGGAPVRRVGLVKGLKFTDATNVPSGAGLVYANAAQFTQADLDYLWRNDYRVQFSGSFTCAAWVKRVESDAAGYRHIVSNLSGPTGYRLFITHDSTLVSDVYDSGGVSQLHNSGAGGTPLVTGTWHLVRMWYDAATGFHYNQKDLGVIASDAIAPTGLVRGPAGISISTAALGWGGLIGPVMWWNRVLTTAEWAQLYNGGLGWAYTGGLEAAGWRPTDITGCQLWLSADDLNGNGDWNTDRTHMEAIGSWLDLSGNARHLSQTVAAAKPTLRTDILPYQWPTLQFDGTDYLFTNANMLTGSAGTVFAALRQVNLTVWQHVLSSADEASGTRWLRFMPYYEVIHPNMAVAQGNADVADTVKGSTAINTLTNYIMMWQSTGTAYVFRLNGADQTEALITGANTGDWFGDVTGLDNIAVGALKYTSVIQYLHAYLYEIVVYDSVLTGPQIATVEAYLAARWGVTLP